eukprot:7149745-Heterocapsa_arctica.AAC.1
MVGQSAVPAQVEGPIPGDGSGESDAVQWGVLLLTSPGGAGRLSEGDGQAVLQGAKPLEEDGLTAVAS